MKKSILGIAMLAFFSAGGAAAQSCEWCGMADGPAESPWSIQIAADDEPGERMFMEGVVYEADGVTPAPGVRLYVYHTNVHGIYPTRGDETGNGRRHGYLRGWLTTDERGRYEFESIRPAAYQPEGGEPAHIHYTVQAPGGDEFWIDATWFADDPRLTPQRIARVRRPAGESNVIELVRDESGRWVGRRDIVLGSF